MPISDLPGSSQSPKNGSADAADGPQMAADQKISAKIYQICVICVLLNYFDAALPISDLNCRFGDKLFVTMCSA
jgi:hypothetical protein